MAQKRILIRRHQGGLGDVICSFVAVRAARELYPDAEIIAAYGAQYHGFAYGQLVPTFVNDCISPSLWDTEGDKAFFDSEYGRFSLESFDRVIDLDGPEVQHAHETNWELTKNRIEVWCDAVGHRPNPLVPRLALTDQFRGNMSRRLKIGGLDPFSYIVVQWTSAEPFKNYPHTMQLIEGLVDRGHKVVVAHDKTIGELAKDGGQEDALPVWTTPNFMYVDLVALVETARLVIAPDSSFLHIAAATDTPCLALFSGTRGELTCKDYRYTRVIQNHQAVAGKPCEGTYPCFGLKERNFWCAGREEAPFAPYCLEMLSSARVIIEAERWLEENAAYEAERKRRVMESVARAVNVKVDRSKYMDNGKKILVIGMPPGIGDSFWALTKVPAILKEDGADQAVICLQKSIPARGKDFVLRFRRLVADCLYQDMPIHPVGENHINPDGTYNYVPSQRGYLGMDWWLEANGHLERGGRLEDWLSEYETDWELALRDFVFEPSDLDMAGRVADELGQYVVFFMGAKENNGGHHLRSRGHNRVGIYSQADWRNFGYLQELYEGMDPRPIWRVKDWIALAEEAMGQGCHVVLVGARYDGEYARDFLAEWKAKHPSCEKKILNLVGQTHIGETFAVITHRSNRATFSYQSGIGILSVYFGIPTVLWWRAKGDSAEPPSNQMVSFDERMASAWAPPWALSTRTYLPLIYGRQSPQMVIEEAIKRGWFDPDRPRGRELLEWRPDAQAVA